MEFCSLEYNIFLNYPAIVSERFYVFCSAAPPCRQRKCKTFWIGSTVRSTLWQNSTACTKLIQLVTVRDFLTNEHRDLN